MVGKVTPNDMLSASRLPAVCGMSVYRSPNDELLSSIDSINGISPPDISNEAMGWGNKMEPTILLEAANRLNCKDLEIDYHTPFFHDKWPLSCSLDGTAYGKGQVIVSDPDNGIYVVGKDSITLDGMGVLEAKLTSMPAEDVLPLYRGPIQLQAQMSIMKAGWGAVCTLYQGTQLRIFLFEAHLPTLRLIQETSKTFQEKIDRYRNTGEIDYYPPINPKDAARTWASGSDDEPVVLDSYAEELTKLLLENKQKITKAEEENSKIQTEIMGMLKNNTAGIAGEYRISWPTRTYKAQVAKITPAKEAYTIRQSTLSIKELTK